MPGRFNPERRIERRNEETQPEQSVVIDGKWLDDKIYGHSGTADKWNKYKKFRNPSQRTEKGRAFVAGLEVSKSEEDTPLISAYRTLELARQSGDKDAIIDAEEAILDLERANEEQEYVEAISAWKIERQNAREKNDAQALEKLSKKRQQLLTSEEYDRLSYEKKKLELAQRREPTNENIRKLAELNKQLRDLEDKSQNR